MKREDLLTILITFMMGLAFGFYVYVTGFAPTSERVATSLEPDIEDTLVITGEAYGGCDRSNTCPTFNIADDGSYRYLFTPLGADASVIREGTLPLTLQKQLKDNITESGLRTQSQTLEPIFCESFVDGIDVEYTVSLGGSTYRLNSCGTDVIAESPLWQALSNVWTYYERNI